MRQNWEEKILGDICDFQNGYAFKSTDYSENGSFVIRIGNVQNGFIELSNPRYIDKIDKVIERFVLNTGDILVSLTGNVGRVGVICEEHLPAVLNQRVARIILKKNTGVYKNYLLYFLQSSIFLEELIEAGHGAAQQNVSTTDISCLSIQIPPLPEQKRIVAVLDEAFAALAKAKENTEKNLVNAKELFDTFIRNLFCNSKKDWEMKKLGELATFRNGMNFTKGSKGEKIKIVGVRDFQNSLWVPYETLESVTIDGNLSETDLLNEDDILAVRSNGNPALIGRTLIAGEVVGKVSHSGFTIRIRLDSKNISPLYLCHYLKTQKSRKELMESGTGINIKSLNQGALSSLEIVFPKSINEQKVVVRKLDDLSAETKKLEAIYQQKLFDLDELKKTLLQKAFNGELTSSVSSNVSVANIIPFPKLEGISATDLQAGITAIAFKKHIAQKKEHLFHHVKAEKIAHLAEYILNIDLERNPVKDAAGPNDFRHAKKVESRARKAGFYYVHKEKGYYTYQVGNKMSTIIQKTENCLDEKLKTLSDLIDLLIPMKSQQAEIVATVYAAWNNLILEGEAPSDEDIVTEARENWHKEKLKIERIIFFNAIKWMREHELLVPKGNGKIVAKK